METYEKYKMLTYLANAMSDRRFLRDNLARIVDWHGGFGYRLFSADLLTGKEKEEGADAETVFRRNKREGLLRGEAYLQKLQKKLRRRCRPGVFEKRLENVAALLRLSPAEKEVLGVLTRIKLDEDFDDFNRMVCGRNNKLKDNLAFFLNFGRAKTESLIDHNSRLKKLGLAETEYNGDISASDLAGKLLSQNLRTPADVKDFLLGRPQSATLDWEDFSYLPERDYCAKILQKAAAAKIKGVNLLFYGEPGTGKTEFAKALAVRAGANLYAVGENGEKDNSRKESLELAFSLLESDRNSCLLVDEADDFLESSHPFFKNKEKNDKLYVNRLLENNRTPAIWIVNSIADTDRAYLRRFTHAVHFRRPDLQVRTNMWQRSLREYNLPADRQTAAEFAGRYRLSPSFIVTAVKSAKLAGGGLDDVHRSLSSLEKAFNNGRQPAEKKKNAVAFNPQLLNTDTDLQLLAERIAGLPQRNFSLCLYGASGTGKSAYAEYLAEKLEMPVLKKRCSDLLSMWVGGSEANIAEAFAEGRENRAVLVFDEADSFLSSRQSADHSWEVTKVNEMLTQMESYPYPFVCTTNLMEFLDEACLRRFTFKVAYDYLTPQQSALAFKHFFDMEDVPLERLDRLAPGDFVVVKQKATILGLAQNREELLKMLENERKNRIPVKRKIGFV